MDQWQKKRKYRSKLGDHKRFKKELKPPLNIIDFKKSSWFNERYPEVLWVSLIVTHLKRDDALRLLREISVSIKKNEAGYDISHTGLAKLEQPVFNSILDPINRSEQAKEVLSSLFLLKEIPDKSRWEGLLGKKKADYNNWNLLAGTALDNADHQTQEATDVRWFKVLTKLLAGKIKLPNEESVLEIIKYPNYGDQKKVRPTIRATEMIFAEASVWPELFWKDCFEKTQCIPMNLEESRYINPVGVGIRNFDPVFFELIKHFIRTEKSKKPDNQHEALFGLLFYSFNLLSEIMKSNSQNISSRLILRSVFENYIYLKYLVQKDDQKLWEDFVYYGRGQAKLALLKLEGKPELVNYIRVKMLEQITNEGVWEEFININLGQWAGSDLRKISEEVGEKDLYDQYYGWTSGYTHSNFGAIRESVYYVCGNPLHRFHRIPQTTQKNLPSVIPDIMRLINKSLDLLNKKYPYFKWKLKL